MSSKQIARLMQVSPKTIENHRHHIMSKLAIHDRVELVRFAVREGLVDGSTFSFAAPGRMGIRQGRLAELLKRAAR